MDLKEKKHALNACQAKIKQLTDQLSSAATRKETLSKTQASMSSVLKIAKEAEVVSLYVADHKPGDYLKSKTILEKQKELISRVDDEVGKIQSQLKSLHKEEISLKLDIENTEQIAEVTGAVVISLEDYRERQRLGRESGENPERT